MKSRLQPAPYDIGALSLTAWQMALGTVPLVVVALVVPEQAIDWSPRFIAILLFVSVTSAALGWLLWAYVIDRLPAWQASLGVLGVLGVPVVRCCQSVIAVDT